MKKLIFILLFIISLSSCNKTSDTNQGEPEKFKLRMNGQRYISEADETIEQDSLYDNSARLKDYHNFFIEIKDEYELNSISLVSYDILSDETNYQSHNCDFTYALSNESLNVKIDENCVSDDNHILVLNLLIDYNGQHNFRIRISGYKTPDYSTYFRLLMNDKKYVFETKEILFGGHYNDFILLDDYHNLYIEMEDDYAIERLELLDYPNVGPAPKINESDSIQFSYNLTDNKLEIKIDENYIIDDGHELVLYLKVIYNGVHIFLICIDTWNHWWGK